MLNFFFSPLEQFDIVPLYTFRFGPSDIILTNETVVLAMLAFFTFSVFFALNSVISLENGSFNIVPSRTQSALEMVYNLILSLVSDNIKDSRGQLFFPLVFFLFFFIVSLNVIGLLPYSFTITSHIVVTLGLSLAVFIGINIVCIRIHGLHFFALFLPPGTSFALAFLLVPIELISYVFKPISLSIRLFANMMAGHTLLKVIAGFAGTLAFSTGLLQIVYLVPALILIPLFGLELAVAFIQAFVFSILICIYLNDAISLH